MQTVLQAIAALPQEKWDYYLGIDENTKVNNPFLEARPDHIRFIEHYFKRGGKVDLFEQSAIQVKGLRLPNHINSVFFLGILFFYQTNLHTKYHRGTNPLGYQNFPFIWFLIPCFMTMPTVRNSRKQAVHPNRKTIAAYIHKNKK